MSDQTTPETPQRQGGPCSAFVLVERGGSYDTASESMVMVSLDRKPLDAMADTHAKKQRASRIKLVDRTYMEVEEVSFLSNK